MLNTDPDSCPPEVKPHPMETIFSKQQKTGWGLGTRHQAHIRWSLTLYIMNMCCFSPRMFCSMMDLKPNEQGEYEVAKGVSANIFRALLVRGGGKGEGDVEGEGRRRGV